MIFSQNLFRCPTNIHVEFLFEFLCVGATPQLALPVEFLFEFLCVEARQGIT